MSAMSAMSASAQRNAGAQMCFVARGHFLSGKVWPSRVDQHGQDAFNQQHGRISPTKCDYSSFLFISTVYSCRRQWPTATIADVCAGWLRKLSKFRMSSLTRQGCVQLRLERKLFVDFLGFH